MEENEIIKVNVTEVNPGYILIEYNGFPATLQITELTWKPGLVNPSEYVSVGDVIAVKVTKIMGDKYSVSLREALPGGNPWDNPPRIGDCFRAEVTSVTDYGYFFDITDYCRALLMKDDAKRAYNLGDSESVVVKSIDIELHKVGLSVSKQKL